MIDLSIVIPTYNEAQRLPKTLVAIETYIGTHAGAVQLIVADDGSLDETVTIATAHQSQAADYVVLELPHRGKAATVRDGVLAASGSIVLFTDADLSTPIEYADELVSKLQAGSQVAIGSREGIGATRVGEPGYRHVMGRAFNSVVQLLAVPGISDTQCGFKAFEREAAQAIFHRTRLHGSDKPVRGPRVTGFDVEVLYLARRLGYRIAQVPVYWEHVPGSNVHPFMDSIRMFLDVVQVRINAIRGTYS